jgi:hypothetical protein
MKRDRSWIVSLEFTPDMNVPKWAVEFHCHPSKGFTHRRYGRTRFQALLKAVRTRRNIIAMQATIKLTA